MGNKSVNAFIAYSTAGLQLALILILFVYGGFKLDERLGTMPVFVVVGAMAGMGAGLYNLLRGLKEVDRIVREEKSEEKQKRNKWL